MSAAGTQGDLYASRYQRWYSNSRSHLMNLISYHKLLEVDSLVSMGFPKLTPGGLDVFECILRQRFPSLGARLVRVSDNFVFYQESAQYWLKASIGVPYYSKNGLISQPAHGRRISLTTAQETSIAYAILMSSWFYICFQALGDCFHVNQSLVGWLPIPDSVWSDADLANIGNELDQTLRLSALRKEITTKNGDRIQYDEFSVSQSKGLIDQIDKVLGRHLGLSQDQVETLINYDYKFRMGSHVGNESE